VLDWRGEPKSAHALKRAFRPVQLVLSDEGVDGLMLHFVNETAHPIAAVVTLKCLRDGRIGVMRAEKQVTLAPRSTTAIPDVEFWGAFFDKSYAYRFGPPSHDVTIATLRARGRTDCRGFSLPARRCLAAAGHDRGKHRAMPRGMAAPAQSRFFRLICPHRRSRLPAARRLVPFGARTRENRPADRAIRGQLSPAARDRRAAFRRIHLLRRPHEFG